MTTHLENPPFFCHVVTSNRSAFTLVEIMLVVIIIGVLAAIVVPQFTGSSEEARINRAKADIQAIKTALGMFELRYGHYPSREEGGLRALIEKPPGIPEEEWKQGLEEMPIDPWGMPYVYLTEADRVSTGRTINVYSCGPNRRDDGWTGDDIPRRREY